MSMEEFGALRDAMVTNTFDDGHGFVFSTPEEAKLFKYFISQSQGWNIIVDGLNLGYKIAKYQPATTSKKAMSFKVCASLLFCTFEVINTYTARPVWWREWISDSYCSLKPLCSGMGEVVPARTSPTLLPPSPRTVLSLSCFKVLQCINCRDWHFKAPSCSIHLSTATASFTTHLSTTFEPSVPGRSLYTVFDVLKFNSWIIWTCWFSVICSCNWALSAIVSLESPYFSQSTSVFIYYQALVCQL